jgi:hypothetical protein
MHDSEMLPQTGVAQAASQHRIRSITSNQVWEAPNKRIHSMLFQVVRFPRLPETTMTAIKFGAGSNECRCTP